MKIPGLLFIGNDCSQPRQSLEHLLLKVGDLRLDILRFTRLAKHGVDLHQVAQGFQVATQGQAVGQQLKALQLDPGGMKLCIGIADQIKVGHQHGQEKQDTYQAEFHPETQPIHQRDGRIQQALHG
ncbi:hypothetical protein D3C77_426280 [compost metagenome]